MDNHSLQLPAQLDDHRLLSIAVGTGIAGALVDRGHIVDHLFEPGKACLNLEPSGSEKFPHGLAANNQVARRALEGIARRLLRFPDDFAFDLRQLATLANLRDSDPLPAWLPPGFSFGIDQTIQRASETFLMLGRALGDLVASLNLHLDASKIGIAGGPMQAMPERIHAEIVDRCAVYGLELESGTDSVKTLSRATAKGVLADDLRLRIEGSERLTYALLERLLDRARHICRLSQYSEIDDYFAETYGTAEYLPVAAMAAVMEIVGEKFATAKRIPIRFDDFLAATIVLPDDIGQLPQHVDQPHPLDVLLAKFSGALCVNQAVTRGFNKANFVDAAAIAETLAPLELTETVEHTFIDTPRSAGMAVISHTYYETWRRVCELVRRTPADPITVSDSPRDGETQDLIRVGVDIGGTEVKIAVLKWGGAHWELCVSDAGECLTTCKTDDVVGKQDARLNEFAERVLRRIEAAVDRYRVGGRVISLGIVFPAAIALRRAIGGTSGTAARFVGQTPVIVDATPEQLLELDIRGALKEQWNGRRGQASPRVVLTNDGPAFATGAMLAFENRPLGIQQLKNREGAFGAIGAAALD